MTLSLGERSPEELYRDIQPALPGQRADRMGLLAVLRSLGSGLLPGALESTRQVPATVEMACKVVALATLDREQGRELGLRCGANVVVPNLTPVRYRADYEIYPAKAREALRRQSPDVAVVDIMMDNGIPGFDLAREIHAKAPDAVILMVSSLNSELKQPLDFTPDAKLPIFKFLDKPVRGKALVQEIEQALASVKKKVPAK